MSSAPTARLSVSIAMCTCDAAKFVREQLDSFLAQTWLPMELVIQDDASTDATLSIVEDFAKHAPFPVLLERNPTRLGPTGNFERAMGRCRGEVLVFSDADDTWNPDRIETAVAVLIARPEVGAVFSDAALASADLCPRGVSLWESIGFTTAHQQELLSGQLTDAFFRRTIGFGGSMTVRRSVIEAALPIARPWGHDNWTAVIAASLFDVSLIPRTLMLYRQHGSQYSGGSKKGLWKRAQNSRQVKPQKDWVPRASSYLQLKERLTALRPRASDQPRLDRSIADATAKAEHQEMREALSKHLVLRLGPVLRDTVRLRYRRYSSGLLSTFRDLVFGRY